MSPIIEIDVHGLTAMEAVNKIDRIVQSVDSSVYRIRIIHGYHGGTKIREAIRREFGFGLEPKIKRIVPGDNEGITDFILKEYY